jgi:hypothetical protein
LSRSDGSPNGAEAVMGDAGYFDGEEVGDGMTAAAIQEVARRQLGASIAVAVVIVVGLGLAALMPASRDYAESARHKVASVQQPTFTSPSDRVASAHRFERELP